VSQPRRPTEVGPLYIGLSKTAFGVALIPALLIATACGRGSPPPVSSPAPAAPQPAAPVASLSLPPEETKSPIVYQSRGRRDPFREPGVATAQHDPVVNLKLTGVVWGPRVYYALVESESPPGVGYIIRENDVVGSARVLKITRENVIFEVRTMSATGKPVTRYVAKHIRPVEAK